MILVLHADLACFILIANGFQFYLRPFSCWRLFLFAIDRMSLAIAFDLAACVSFGIGDFFVVGGDVSMLQLF